MSRLSAWIRAWRERRQPPVEQTPEPPPPQFPPVRLYQPRHINAPAIQNSAAAEYSELASVAAPQNASPPIFITARFRSGSTLLWNLLRQTPGLTTYYEPLHPTLQLPPNQRLRAEDSTHTGVTDYWSEYDQIEGFLEHATEPWDRESLYLDAGDWKPVLAEYLQLLIRSAVDRPVLQFNRADFRLTWLRHMFPDAKLVHLFRHPRDQWLSVLRDPAAFGPHDVAEQFIERDYFFLIPWARDLSAQFPVLDWARVDHPYQMHYLIWKLSYLWGQAYSDLSLSYEQLLTAPGPTLSTLFSELGLDQHLIAPLTQLIRPQKPGKWRTYADASWFADQEHCAEQLLTSFLGPQPVARLSEPGLSGCGILPQQQRERRTG